MESTDLEKHDRAARDIIHQFIGDIKTGVIAMEEVLSDSQYRGCLAEYGYSNYTNDPNIRYKVAWAVNKWVTDQKRAAELMNKRNTLAVQIATAFSDLCVSDRRYTYTQLCDFIIGCCSTLDPRLAGKVAALVDHKLASKGLSPLVGYDEEYSEVINGGG